MSLNPKRPMVEARETATGTLCDVCGSKLQTCRGCRQKFCSECAEANYGWPTCGYCTDCHIRGDA